MTLLEEIELFLEEVKPRMTPSEFSRLATGDDGFVAELRLGRIPLARRCTEVRLMMRKYRGGEAVQSEPLFKETRGGYNHKPGAEMEYIGTSDVTDETKMMRMGSDMLRDKILQFLDQRQARLDQKAKLA